MFNELPASQINVKRLFQTVPSGMKPPVGGQFDNRGIWHQDGVLPVLSGGYSD